MFDRRLRAARVLAGFTQVELGKRCGVDGSTISRIERGLTAPRDLQEQIAKVLQKPIGELFPAVSGNEPTTGSQIIEAL